MLNPIFWEKVQGQKHPGRWVIVEHQIPSTKVLSKTNAKSHKHPSIKPLPSESKTQLATQRKQNTQKSIYICIDSYINTELLDGNKGHQVKTHHLTHMFRHLFLDLLYVFIFYQLCHPWSGDMEAVVFWIIHINVNNVRRFVISSDKRN